MSKPLTSAQMRAIEQAAIDSGQVTGLTLMERAGLAVCETVLKHWPALVKTPPAVLVLCGPGNNGGDGFVIARGLQALGFDIEVLLLGDADNLPPDAETSYWRWCDLGQVHDLQTEIAYLDIGDYGLVVDALFGTGLTRNVPPEVQAVALTLADARESGTCPKVVAVDLPSGLNSDSGAVMGQAISADLTVTFHAEKQGHRTGMGPDYCGTIVVKDIGLSPWQEISPPEA